MSNNEHVNKRIRDCFSLVNVILGLSLTMQPG